MAFKLKQVKENLVQLSNVRASEARLQKQFDNSIAAHEEKYLQAIKPLQDKFEPKLSKARAEIAALEKAISEQLLSNQDRDGEPKLREVTAGGLTAEVTVSSRRMVKAHDFFKLVPSNQRDFKFYNCLSVLIGKAEKLLGDRISEIAELKNSWKVKISK